MELDDLIEDNFALEPEVRSPWALLAVAAVSVIASGVLLLWRGEVIGLVGYGLAALVAVMAVALYRYVDGRRQTLAQYRPALWAGKAAVGLLVAAWLVSCGHAWQLATIWAKS